MPIIIANLNEELEVKRLLGDDKVRKRLESIGIYIGSKLSILSKEDGGIIVALDGSRIALDHSVAKYIIV